MLVDDRRHDRASASRTTTNSPFVQEKFHEDWSHDGTWGWQQNRAVVGHNLKIAWNLMRIHHMRPDAKYVELAQKIAGPMPKHGSDQQRGGWYDVVERVRKPGEEATPLRVPRPQGVVAAGAGHPRVPDPGRLDRDEEALRSARESAAFYNAFFLDHDSGAVYFNVLANGIPYLLGTERHKGSHSMAGYHSFELCYLAAVYTNLLITKQPLDLRFKPDPGRLQGQHPARLARHAAAGQHQDRRGRGGRRAVRRLRRRRADGQGPRRQEAGQDPGPRRADHRPVRGDARRSTATSPR